MKIGTFEVDNPYDRPDFVDEGYDYLINAFGRQLDDVFYHCPCCRFPTLKTRGSFEICEVCFWEDDGQDDHDVDRVRGGPNGHLSLADARDNFNAYGACCKTMIGKVRMPTKKEMRYKHHDL